MLTKNANLYIMYLLYCIQNTYWRERVDDRLRLKAYAKINLGLDVLGRLSNGYHEVKMVMQTVDIYDELSFEKIPEGIEIVTDCGELPLDENNLIYKAIRLMQETYRVTGGVRVELQKNIPIAAGMAGGSTDAACALRAMNILFQLGATDAELQNLGVKIGADVPYCVCGGTVLAEGIGEKLTPLKAVPDCCLLVAKPNINVSSKYVYEHLDAMTIQTHPDIDGMVDAINRGDFGKIVGCMGNVLENVTIEAHPVIARIKEQMCQNGAINSMMSGSGPTVFGIYAEEGAAQRAYGKIEKLIPEGQLFVTRLWGGTYAG